MEGLTEQQYNDLVVKFGKDAALELAKVQVKIETDLNEKYKAVVAGSITRADFDLYKTSQEDLINEKVKEITKLEDAMKVQGTEILKLQQAPAGTKRSLEDYIEKEVGPQVKKMREDKTGCITLTSAVLKAAGVTSISNSVTAMAGSALTSPYLPGIGGGPLELFEIVRNPNWIINKVDLGRTDQVRLAWINETSVLADTVASSNVAEAGLKPLVQHIFTVEYSVAKKAAAYIKLTEEFDVDLPGLATAVRRMLEEDVMRAFDDAIQAAVIAAARPYEITGLTHDVDGANKYDAIGAELAQIAYYNFVANTVALNPVTEWSMLMSKNTVVTSGAREYLDPPFWPIIQSKLIEATKVAINYALAGDLKQYKVDLYKDLTIRIGWVNDDFIYNQFIVLGELRYHSYISDNRKKAIVYDNLDTIIAAIRSGS